LVVVSGRLYPWTPGEIIELPLHELHAHNSDGQQTVEFLLNDRENGAWIYRRDPTIRRPLSDTIRRDGSLRFLAPEVVLLYKSKAPRATDEEDFHNALPDFSGDARTWLIEALARVDSAHPWLEPLRVTEAQRMLKRTESRWCNASLARGIAIPERTRPAHDHLEVVTPTIESRTDAQSSAARLSTAFRPHVGPERLEEVVIFSPLAQRIRHGRRLLKPRARIRRRNAIVELGPAGAARLHRGGAAHRTRYAARRRAADRDTHS
jgi:hypothetical protein